MNDHFANLEKHYSNSLIIKKHPILIQRIYDFFQYIFFFVPFNNTSKSINSICKQYNLKKRNILDIGSFTGYNSYYFYCNRNKVLGIELSSQFESANLRYKRKSLSFINGNIFEYLNRDFIEKFDFLFCSNLPIHYDTCNFTSSPLVKTFFKEITSSMAKGTILYFIFYSTKHPKVGFPVSHNDVKHVMNELQIDTYLLNEKVFFDFPMVELVITK